MSQTDTIISRAYAKANGLTHYFPGSTCTHGHIAKRYTASGTCTACLSDNKGLFCERRKASNRTPEGQRRVKANNLRSLYDISLEDYEAKLKQQDHKCALCGLPFDDSSKSTKVHVDHDHTTGKVRDLLHNNCNAMLGLAGDNVERLKKGIQYLRRHANVS